MARKKSLLKSSIRMMKSFDRLLNADHTIKGKIRRERDRRRRLQKKYRWL